MKMKTVFTLCIWMLTWMLNACSAQGASVSATPTPIFVAHKIDRDPGFMDFQRKNLQELGTYDPESRDALQIDLRSYDLTQLDLRSSIDTIRYADFDDHTLWPAEEHMPAGFDPKKVLELGKNPGLGVRGLHADGITGSKVGIAIIDQPLVIENPEYFHQLRLYEEIDIPSDMSAQMHAPAVASLAVGKTVGTAPGADLYFIAEPMWNAALNFRDIAQSIRRILEINRGLPLDRKIRVISVSREFGSQETGFSEVMAAIREADQAGIPVISVGRFGSKVADILGLGRDLMADPDPIASYRPSIFLAPSLDKLDPNTDANTYANALWVPIDARGTAGPTGPNDYAFYGVGGMSWAEPYLAGIYALACQVAPQITPDRFWTLALETGKPLEVEKNGQKINLGKVLDPVDLIKNLR